MIVPFIVLDDDQICSEILYNIIMLFVKSNDSFAWESLKIIINEMYLFIPANIEKTIQKKLVVATFQTYFRRLFLMVVV